MKGSKPDQPASNTDDKKVDPLPKEESNIGPNIDEKELKDMKENSIKTKLEKEGPKMEEEIVHLEANSENTETNSKGENLTAKEENKKDDVDNISNGQNAEFQKGVKAEGEKGKSTDPTNNNEIGDNKKE